MIIGFMAIAALGLKSTEILAAAEEDSAVDVITDESTQPSSIPTTARFTGEYVCLPHTDTSGPQTMECAFGLKLEDGSYVALDFNRFPPEEVNFSTGSILTLNGDFVPVEALSSDHWQKYPIQGIVSVSEVIR